jgi:hypothetical protein
MEQFSIKLLKLKYLVVILAVLLFSLLAIFLPFLEFQRNGEFRLISIPMTFGGFLLLYFFIKLSKFWRIRSELIFISKGNLINHSALFKGGLAIDINTISSISYTSGFPSRPSQLVIYKTKENQINTRNTIFSNQFTGKTIYITSYFIGKKNLKQLFEYLNSKV